VVLAKGAGDLGGLPERRSVAHARQECGRKVGTKVEGETMSLNPEERRHDAPFFYFGKYVLLYPAEVIVNEGRKWNARRTVRESNHRVFLLSRNEADGPVPKMRAADVPFLPQPIPTPRPSDHAIAPQAGEWRERSLSPVREDIGRPDEYRDALTFFDSCDKLALLLLFVIRPPMRLLWRGTVSFTLNLLIEG
jgi:hypothetical protein